MRRRYTLLNLLSAVTAASITIVMIVGLFYSEGVASIMTSILLQVVVVVIALAVLIGLLNLLRIHYSRMRHLEKGWFYSLIVLLTFVAVITLRLIDPITNDGTATEVSPVVFNVIQVSIESALAGLLFFFLVYAAYRMFNRGFTMNGCLFITALLIGLVGWVPLKDIEIFGDLRTWLLEIPVTAGSRGMLIGIGLATVTAGLRVLIGQERAYREE